MLNAEFQKVISDVPHIVAIFTITKVPAWASQILKVGDEVYWNAAKDSMRTFGTLGQPHGRKNLDIRANYVKFDRFAGLTRYNA